MSEYGKNAPLSYGKYLKVHELISLQETLSEPESHDEMLFIIIHQTYELWFKQMLHEIDAIIDWISNDRLFRANHSLKTVVAIGRILVSQIHILETMAPIGFLEFRDRLNPASGFQSFQFREIEFVSGLKDEKILESFKNDENSYKRLKRRYDSPSLADVFWQALEKRGFNVSDSKSKVDAIVKILEKPEREPQIYVMQDLLIDHDENISLWRYHHVLMVERMLGMKRGTGGSEGAAYLRTTLNKKFMPELWEARTYLKIS
ncbi:MAG: tryptophan 2,3-dioxygenase family protein [Pyrinomonadaceae bacterium]|nr:tryptophan 2,3-dioxygenase family protein [Pyrinomonadaceae bacterium]MCX7640602.1 tryptophan 2,3-dioxygenase family protein [Pyrinomonadaceae bacterium]MDW8303817.1 tryptophan 2,3-dioxygenase family protein [Acidobacteriota bacterium]